MKGCIGGLVHQETVLFRYLTVGRYELNITRRISALWLHVNVPSAATAISNISTWVDPMTIVSVRHSLSRNPEFQRQVAARDVTLDREIHGAATGHFQYCSVHATGDGRQSHVYCLKPPERATFMFDSAPAPKLALHCTQNILKSWKRKVENMRSGYTVQHYTQ